MDTDRRGTGEKTGATAIRKRGYWPVPLAAAGSKPRPAQFHLAPQPDRLIAWLADPVASGAGGGGSLDGLGDPSPDPDLLSREQKKRPAQAGPEGMVSGRPEGLHEAFTRGRGSGRERARERASERVQGLEPVRARAQPRQRRVWRTGSGSPAWRQRPGKN